VAVITCSKPDYSWEIYCSTDSRQFWCRYCRLVEILYCIQQSSAGNRLLLQSVSFPTGSQV